MGGDDLSRLERKLDAVQRDVTEVRETIAGVSQWKQDTSQLCPRHTQEIGELREALNQERLNRTEAVGKLWTAVGRKLTAKATAAAFVGALGPSLVLLVKLWPAITTVQNAGG